MAADSLGRFRVRAAGAAAALLLSLAGCGPGGGAAGTAPFGEAGPGQVARVGALVVLDGSASADPERHPLTFHWSQVEGPVALLSDPADARPEFTPTVPGTYVFSLIVAAGSGEGSLPDTVTVVVVDDTSAQPRRAPGAVARAAGLSHATFLSAPPPGDLATTPPTLVLADGSVRAVSIVDLVGDATDDPTPGDIAGLSRVDLGVGGAPLALLYYPALAGDDDPTGLDFGGGALEVVVAYGVAGAAFVLDGTRSHDDGVVKTFTWTQVSGPFAFTTEDPTISVVPVTAGTYVFDLVVSDDVGLASFPQRVSIPVLPTASPGVGPPVARLAVVGGATLYDVGARQGYVSNGGVVIVLDGATSESRGGGALTYEWTQLEGPIAVVTGASSPSAQFHPETPGAYLFELTVTDANGVSHATSLWVSVGDTPATAPLASAAPLPDAALPLPGMPPLVVSLDGSASESSPLREFTWTQVEGPPFVVDWGPVPGVGLVSIDQAGRYAFELRVLDGRAYSPPSTVSFTVR